MAREREEFALLETGVQTYTVIQWESITWKPYIEGIKGWSKAKEILARLNGQKVEVTS